MSASKPLVFRVLGAAARLAGRRRAERAIAAVSSALIRLPPLRGGLLRGLARIRPGAAAGPYLAELAEVFAAEQAAILLADSGLPPAPMALDAWPAIEACRARGKGVILATPHFGNVVAALLALGEAGLPTTCPAPNAAAYHWMERGGLRFVSVGSAALSCRRALARNEAVFLYADLDFSPAEPRPFFGAPYHLPRGPERLSAWAGAPVLPLYCARRGGGWALECDPVIEPGADVCAALVRSMERRIAERPGHWALLRDAWDLEGSARLNRLQLEASDDLGR